MNAVFSPEPLLLVGVGAVLLWLSFNYKEEPRFFILVNVLAAIFTGSGVAFIKGRYDAAIQESMLLKKGRSAVRNLESIGQQVAQLRKWIKLFIAKRGTTKRDLEEVERHLSTTEMNIASGMEDWVDIVPELRKTEEEISAHRDLLRSYSEELRKDRKALLQLREDKDKERLEKRIKELEKTVKKLKEEQPSAFGGAVGISGFPGSAASFGVGGSLSALSSLDEKICERCGRRYKEDLSVLSTISSKLCPNCQWGGGNILT